MNTHNTPIISLGTFLEKDFTSGGSSFFDIQNYKYDTVNVIWTSDSSALIEYPSTASVMRKDSKTNFFQVEPLILHTKPSRTEVPQFEKRILLNYSALIYSTTLKKAPQKCGAKKLNLILILDLY